MLNREDDRRQASGRLIEYVMANHKEGEDITLIGYSHGGNVTLQAVLGLRKALDARGEVNTKINILLFSTPSYNGKGDPENPLTVQAAFDKLDYFYTKPEKGSFAVFDKTVTQAAFYSGADLYYHDPEEENPWRLWESPAPLQNSKITAHPVKVGNDYPEASGNTHGWIFFFDKVVTPYIKEEQKKQQQSSSGGS